MDKQKLLFPLLLLLFLCLLSLSLGRFSIPLSDTLGILLGQQDYEIQRNIILNLRLPRTLAAILVGTSLAIAGVVYQGIFRNPLVSPDILGVSNGACVGAALAILIGSGMLGHSSLCLCRWFDCRLAHHEFTAFNSTRLHHCIGPFRHYRFRFYDGNIRPIEIPRRSRNPAS